MNTNEERADAIVERIPPKSAASQVSPPNPPSAHEQAEPGNIDPGDAEAAAAAKELSAEPAEHLTDAQIGDMKRQIAASMRALTAAEPQEEAMETMEGHWNTREGAEMAARYAITPPDQPHRESDPPATVDED